MKVVINSAPSLWSDIPFRRFLLARAISWAGSAITLIALPLLLFQRTGSVGLTAALTALEALPYLAFGLIAGALADRWSRRRIMVVASIANATVLATVPITDAMHLLGPTHLLIVAFTSAGLAVFFDAASFAALPALIGKDRLPAATSISVSTSTVIGMAGPPAGGTLAATLGAANVLAVDAISFLLAAAVIAGLPIGRPAPAPHRRRFAADIAEGLRYIWRQPLIRSLTLLGIGNSMTAGAVLGLLVATAVHHLGLPDTDARIGLLYGACGLGTLIAGIALPRLTRIAPIGWITLGGLAANWALLLGWTFTTAIPLALLILCAWQATNSLVTINGILARQQLSPDHLQGRVNATARMIAWGGQPLGAATAGTLAEHWSIQTALLITGSAVACAALLGLLTPLRLARGVADPPRVDGASTQSCSGFTAS